MIHKAPYLKGKGYMNKLCYVAINGIPKEADARRDKRVIGTPAYISFWTEELHKIIHGVDCPGGIINLHLCVSLWRNLVVFRVP